MAQQNKGHENIKVYLSLASVRKAVRNIFHHDGQPHPTHPDLELFQRWLNDDLSELSLGFRRQLQEYARQWESIATQLVAIDRAKGEVKQKLKLFEYDRKALVGEMKSIAESLARVHSEIRTCEVVTKRAIAIELEAIKETEIEEEVEATSTAVFVPAFGPYALGAAGMLADSKVVAAENKAAKKTAKVEEVAIVFQQIIDDCISQYAILGAVFGMLVNDANLKYAESWSLPIPNAHDLTESEMMNSKRFRQERERARLA